VLLEGLLAVGLLDVVSRCRWGHPEDFVETLVVHFTLALAAALILLHATWTAEESSETSTEHKNEIFK
jgi:hypothetical protein